MRSYSPNRANTVKPHSNETIEMRRCRISPWDGVILAGLGGLILGLTWPLWSAHPDAQAAIAPGDMTIYYYPFARYAVESLRAGQIPLWNPYVLGGHTFLAELQTQVLYPVRWVTALLTLGEPFSYRALAAETVAHLILAAWGAYGFFRWLSHNRAAATFGAVAWGLSGYLTGYPLQAPPILATAAWLPWLLWSMGRALTGQRHQRRNALLATASWTLVFLSGFAQTALYIYGITLLWGAALILSQPAQKRRSALLTLLLIIVIGSGLTAAQLLPTLEATTLSKRLDLPSAERLAGFKVWELLGLVLPHVTLWSPLYLGIPTLALAGLAFRRHRSGPTHPGLWLALALFGLLLTLGDKTFVLPTLSRVIPILAMFRNPERAVVITVWALTVLAVLGWRSMRVEPAPRRYTQALGIAWGASGLALAGLFLWAQMQASENAFQPWLGRALWPWLMLGGSWLLLRRWPKAGPKAKWASAWAAQWALVALLVVDLGATAWRTAQQGHFVWQDPADVAMAPLEAVELPAEARLQRLDSRGFLTGNWPSNLGLEDLHGHLTFENGYWMRFREEIPGDRVWALMGVGCGIWSADEALPPFEVQRFATFPYEERTLHLLCLKQPFPRYRVVYEAAALEDGITLGVLADHRFDLRETVLLESSALLLTTSAPLTGPVITLQSRLPQETRLTVQTAQAGYLVIGDLWYPGWEATINGQRTPILRAFTTLRAVEIPAGEHEISMRYRPLTFRAGAAISLISLVGFSVWALAPWRKSRAG